jgi:hypothetical protein
VWLVSKEAAFLRGRFVWSNWDVEELLAREDEFKEDPLLLTLGLTGLSMKGWSLEQTMEYASKNSNP